MKANELRIGNYVEIDQYPNDRVIIQIENGTDIDQCIKLSPEPILLTEEWFLKFGFVIKPTRSFHKTPIYFRGDMDSDYCFSYADFRDDYGFYIEYTDSPFKSDDYKLYPISFGIKYVHQLQNLYFSVVGAELELEETNSL
jgi:hypothetical protein